MRAKPRPVNVHMCFSILPCQYGFLLVSPVLCGRCFNRALEGGNCNDASEDGATLAKRHGPQPTRPSEVAPAASAHAPHSTHLDNNHSNISSTCAVPHGCHTGTPLPSCFGSVREVHRAGGTNVPSSSVGSCERGQRLSNYQSRGSDPMSRIETCFNAY